MEPNVLVLADKKTGEERRIDFGVCVWCTGALPRCLLGLTSGQKLMRVRRSPAGIKMNPLCSKLIEDLPTGAQPNIRSLTTDASLRVKVRWALTPSPPVACSAR